jgi:hypothetical protein
MAILDLHLQFFIVTIGEITTDAADDLFVIDLCWCSHGQLLVVCITGDEGRGAYESSPIYVAIVGHPRELADVAPPVRKSKGPFRAD